MNCKQLYQTYGIMLLKLIKSGLRSLALSSLQLLRALNLLVLFLSSLILLVAFTLVFLSITFDEYAQTKKTHLQSLWK
jgi:hypothetical protein